MATSKPEQTSMLALAKRGVALYENQDRMDDAVTQEHQRWKDGEVAGRECRVNWYKEQSSRLFNEYDNLMKALYAMPSTTLTEAGVLVMIALSRLDEIRGSSTSISVDRAEDQARWALASVLHTIQRETGADFTEYGADQLLAPSLFSPDEPKGAAS
jgi:hypothetical protein